MKAYCLFEQSGTFKNEFEKLGVKAYDYDIRNDYGQTDRVVDLFTEIDVCYAGGGSIFDDITPEDIIMAFFPCTLFQENNFLLFQGKASMQRKTPIKNKLKYVIARHETLAYFYKILTELAYICYDRDLKCIIENPYTQPHYLTWYWCIEPTIIDKDRTLNGDYYKKPTQFFFINCEPKNNLVFEPIDYVPQKIIQKVQGVNRQRERSEIHPQYANRFIRQYILESET